METIEKVIKENNKEIKNNNKNIKQQQTHKTQYIDPYTPEYKLTMNNVTGWEIHKIHREVDISKIFKLKIIKKNK